jgi:3-deoxy-manno-octulosonate cytidylyltransferase (CMP-KDO synthetase)
MKIVCIIPARYHSMRFPGKPLALIGNKPMIEWVYRRATLAEAISEVIVATDDQRIYNVVHSFGGQVVMTPGSLASGSDRVAHIAREYLADVFINLQGDEPLIASHLLASICAVFQSDEVYMATPVKKIKNYSELTDPNVVRVVVDKERNALYFTRSVIPYVRDHQDQRSWIDHFPFYKHIGLYAYRRDFLMKLSQWPAGILERAERLEQLRILENGYKIKTVETDYDGISVDTPEDLKKVNDYIQKNKIKLGPNNEEM